MPKKKHVTLTPKNPMKIVFHIFLSSNPKILKAFQKRLISHRIETYTKCPAKGKKMREGEKAFFFGFLCMPELRKLIFRIWNRKQRSVRAVNGFVVGFSSL